MSNRPCSSIPSDDEMSNLPTVHFRLAGEYVELCNLLKLAGLADSGGQGKALVAAGEVTVDGRPESRKTAKIRAGQVVTCHGTRIVVDAG
jgi:ribosome-associated protein